MNSPSPHVIAKSSTDWPEQLAVQIARCYYELGMTQQEIANELGIGRARVIRLLAQARDRGIVSITINSPLLANIELADALRKRYDLVQVEVCLCHAADDNELAAQLGAAAGTIVARRFRDGITIGLGWGITLREFATRLDPHPLHDASVVSLLGSLTRRSSAQRFEATTNLAAKLQAECLYLPGPIICDTTASRDVLLAQPFFKDVQTRALQSDIAVVSIGGVDGATMRNAELVTDQESRSVLGSGAIGNFLGYYIDKNGSVIDHSVNHRILGVTGEDFKPIPERIMVSGGLSKVEALAAVLKRQLLTGLVTDQVTAQRLLSV